MQPTEVRNRSLVSNPLQAHARKPALHRRFVERLFHGGVAVAEPVLLQVDTQNDLHREQRPATFTGCIGWRDQEQLFAGLLALSGVFRVGEGHLCHGTAEA